MLQRVLRNKEVRFGQTWMAILLAVGIALGALVFEGSSVAATDPPSQPLDLIFSAENVRYRVDHFGAGTLGATTGDLVVPENVLNGTEVVKAYLIWSGLGRDDDGVLLQRVGGAPAQRITADWIWNNDTYGGSATWGCCGNELSAYVADITATNIVSASPDAAVYTVSDMDIQHMRGNQQIFENWGVSLLIIYAADDIGPRDVFVKLGNDGLFNGWTGIIGPNSDVQCLGFESDLIDRKAVFEVIVGGVADNSRFNALWGRSGDEDYVDRTVEQGAVWNQNRGLINLPPNINGIDPMLEALEEPTLENNFKSPFDDSSGDEWDVYKRFNVDIPAGHEWACLQVESAAQANRPDLPPVVPGSPTAENVPASIGFLGFIAFIDRAEPPAVEIAKLTNGQDADDPNGSGVPEIAPGATVTWTYEVTNVGTVAIDEADITVTDNVFGDVTTIVDKGDGDDLLSPGETWRYEATGTAINLVVPPDDPQLQLADNVCTGGNALIPPSRAYTNIGTVTIPSMVATDPSSYCGPQPQIGIIKYTNGLDANDPNGPDVPVIEPGGRVTWTYAVTNLGSVDIIESDIAVTDNIFGEVTAIVDKGDGDDLLSPGETWRYEATGTAINLVVPPDDPQLQLVGNVCTGGNVLIPSSRAYTNIGTVTIPSMVGTDPSSYCGPQPKIGIIKYTNGLDANDPDGPDVPVIEPGGRVTWTYAVTNIGLVDIIESDITVSDNIFGEVSGISDKADGDSVLAPGEVWIFIATGQAVDLTASPGDDSGLELVHGVCTQGGQLMPASTAYTNIGTVTIPAMQGSDPSSYCGPPPTGIGGVVEPTERTMKLYLPLLIR